MNSSHPSADAIVVGAGHNGLVAACYLARAGLDVLVVEASQGAGGCTTTAALVPEAPHHLLSPCAADVITMRASTVVSDLELRRHGYREVEIDPAYVALSPDGASLAFWRDPRRTADEIRRFSSKDASAFLGLMRTLDHAVEIALPLIATNPTRPDAIKLARTIRAAARHPGAIRTLLSLASAPAVQAIKERFEHPIVQSAIATIANFGAPITGEGTGVNVTVLAVIARFGMSRPVGGMGALPAALQRCLEAHSGSVRTGAPVEQIRVRDGRATGVVLRTGEELSARVVVCATEPHRALTELLPTGTLEPRLETRARHIPCDNDGCTHFKVEMALKGRLSLPRHAARRSDGLDLRRPSALVGTIDEVVDAIAAAKSGRLPEPLPFVSMVPTAADPSQAPPGQDTLSLWSGWLPHEPPGGWPASKSVAERAFVAHAAQYYDGIESLEIGRAVETPEEISARTGVRNGNVYHVDVTLTRVGPLRPALGFGGYRTPRPGLLHHGRRHSSRAVGIGDPRPAGRPGRAPRFRRDAAPRTEPRAGRGPRGSARMSYAIGTLERDGRLQAVVARDGHLYPVDASVLDMLQDPSLAERIDGSSIAEPDAWLPPVINPRKVIGIGANYKDHLDFAGIPYPSTPYLFLKPASTTLLGAGQTMTIPRVVEQADWEGELAAVIGQRARHVSESDALQHVAGYAVANDFSARDWLADAIPPLGSDWLLHKGWDGFTPLGPLITPAEFVPDPQNLKITLDVDGVRKQDGTTANMVFTVAQLIAHASSIMTLEPGDVFLTGTPMGAGFAREPKERLTPGQTMVVEVDGLGRLTTPTAAE